MAIPRPTDAELAVLRTLWQEGPSTVRRVFEALAKEKKLGYTTALKTLQVMTAKGLVKCDKSSHRHVYTPSQSEEETQATLVDYLLSRAFGGSAMKLVMQALNSSPASVDELDQIRKLIDDQKKAIQ
jgi:predicted transcriptional regulator